MASEPRRRWDFRHRHTGEVVQIGVGRSISRRQLKDRAVPESSFAEGGAVEISGSVHGQIAKGPLLPLKPYTIPGSSFRRSAPVENTVLPRLCIRLTWCRKDCRRDRTSPGLRDCRPLCPVAEPIIWRKSGPIRRRQIVHIAVIRGAAINRGSIQCAGAVKHHPLPATSHRTIKAVKNVFHPTAAGMGHLEHYAVVAIGLALGWVP